MKKMFTSEPNRNTRPKLLLKTGISFLCCIIGYYLSLTNLIAQPTNPPSQPAKLWDKTLGGSNSDQLYSLKSTSDGGYILGGSSSSDVSGDKSENSRGGNDFWVVKINANGSKQWDKTLGGSSEDLLTSVQQTSDGGYILGGYSSSIADGEKSENSRGDIDYWVVKLSSDGTKQWDKTFGGTEMDYLTSLLQTADGGYILGGYSASGASGNKSEASRGGIDFWVVKLDGNGNQQWNKSFGGSGDDNLTSIQLGFHATYILGGYSNSNAGADKSEDSRGDIDYWVVNINGDGSLLWDRTLGGNKEDFLTSLIRTTDGGYLLGGFSNSDLSGEKNESSRGGRDYWVVKMDDNGFLWDKTLGGGNDDVLNSLNETTDGGYILGGDSPSNAGGDKSENPKGGRNDQWVVKISTGGSKQWDKTIGGSGSDNLRSIRQTSDGGYILGGTSDSNISGDKSEDSKGGRDYWVVKLDTDICTDPIASFTATTAYLGNPTIFTDASTNVTQSATYAWDVDGDRIIDYTTKGNISHTYPAVGTYTALLIIEQGNCLDRYSLEINVFDPRCGKNNDKFLVCHKGKELCVAANVLAQHLAHGDILGGCISDNPNARIGVEPEAQPVMFQLQMQASPNPTRGRVQLLVETATEGEVHFEVVDLIGRPIQQKAAYLLPGSHALDFDLQTQPVGLYLIRAHDAVGRQGVVRVSRQ
ncbi:PKD domain-containing protein [Runella aurantiaca]|uniref:PKD domain-containing protein n=1 Tax=Runella aurantiaca TaxID=2282308 RepID=A0A369HYF3_9BACT|nr:hypothetical protein [Runella aurantiaca]RDB02378.1 hypothetical protein DVG78_29005 [Runella aurantiaca]